jgi:hypothetical protein
MLNVHTFFFKLYVKARQCNIDNSTMPKPLGQSWGGMMAVACSSATDDVTLSRLADWLYENEKRAYLTKLAARNPSASAATKAKALQNYRDKEINV